MAAHLKRFAPGFSMAEYADDPEGLTILLGTRKFQRTPGSEEYVLVARITLPAPRDKPLWLLCGQTAKCNQGAVRYIRENHKSLLKRYRTESNFCLMLRLIDSDSYGSDQIGRNSDSLYKSPTDVPPTANYRFGATDTQ